jgi:hypothetical protein
MAREKTMKNKGGPKKMMASMTVKKEGTPTPKYIVSYWTIAGKAPFVRRRLNPEYKL